MSILLAQTDEGGDRVSVAEFENMFRLFAVAGNETLRNGLPGACVALLEHPEAAGELRAAYLRSNFQRGVKRLPVAWTARI